ncbi:EAL domain-containing protein [Novosphingobium resinovorum]|uniref:EAL domain-containing protein n=1 Tax=Novosphingobium TaxID=165696 RepID=UPI001B3C7203|nr:MULTISPECIES: EAL domain-containing protein [Novosphingobium]MBF7010664.1 EAL domain-containing protein [Novosphingobium sp. HR1a]WJM28665.1 EAL domain-containing protein [Novosphingobium resinovorum]
MQRQRIVFIAGILAALATILPLAAAIAYARHRALEAEREHLAEYSDWTLRRAERNFARVTDVFRELQAVDWDACGEDHIARMRKLAVDNLAVEEVGYFQDGKLACTSWGKVTKLVAHGTPDARLAGGFGLYLNVAPQVSAGHPVIVVDHGDYNALVSHERFVDVLTDTPMTVGIATLQGRIIAVNGTAPGDVMRRAASSDGFARVGARIFTSVHDGHFRAFAITDEAFVQSRMARELWALVPLALLTSALLIALIVWTSRRRLTPERALEDAIRRRELHVLYQPIMEIATGLCVGAEALLRWQRSDGTSVSPEVFIPLAEKHRLIEPLTDMMIGCVVADLADMLRRERSVHVAINISAIDMQSGRFLPVLTHALVEAGVAPRQVWLEATERGFMDAAAARETLEKARAQGHMVAIDDFGTGYSSLAQLAALPLDALKIDKSFVDAIGREAATSVVVPHVIEIAHGLNLLIVAEGVETPEQEAYLRAAGVGFAQGWLYARALPAGEFLAFQEAINGRRVSPFLTSLAG